MSPALDGVTLALLEGQLMSGEIGRPSFVSASSAADKFLAIAANQAARRAALRAVYDYIVIGSGASGSVVARRLAENVTT